MVRRGESLYRIHGCPACHETTGSLSHKLEGVSARHEVESLAAYLEKGKGRMPAVSLPDDQRRALASFVLARYP